MKYEIFGSIDLSIFCSNQKPFVDFRENPVEYVNNKR